MQHKQLSIAITILGLLLGLMGCKKSNDGKNCIGEFNSPVTKVEGATIAAVNQEIILTISFTCNNGCGKFGNFIESTSGNSTSIIVNAIYEGCICTQDIPTIKVLYKFKKSQRGTYDLNFKQENNFFLNHTIVVL